jgi:hypothetical protein
VQFAPIHIQKMEIFPIKEGRGDSHLMGLLNEWYVRIMQVSVASHQKGALDQGIPITPLLRP